VIVIGRAWQKSDDICSRPHQEVIRRTHDELYDVKWYYIGMFNNIDVLQFIFMLLLMLLLMAIGFR